MTFFEKLNQRRHLKHASDDELARRYRASGDSRLIGLLYERYSHLLLAVCLKYLRNEADAQDAVMEIFEQLLVSLKIQEIEYFKSWLHQVARNHCFSRLRREKARPTESRDPKEMENTFFVEIDPLVRLSNQEQFKKLERALEQLNVAQKTCLRLFYLEHKSYRDIAEATSYGLSEVKSHIQNGKRNLRNLLAGETPPFGVEL